MHKVGKGLPALPHFFISSKVITATKTSFCNCKINLKEICPTSFLVLKTLCFFGFLLLWVTLCLRLLCALAQKTVQQKQNYAQPKLNKLVWCVFKTKIYNPKYFNFCGFYKGKIFDLNKNLAQQHFGWMFFLFVFTFATFKKVCFNAYLDFAVLFCWG